jgi:ketosteroid isomerase-like protein
VADDPSEPKVEIVRRMYEAFHGGDAGRALMYFHPEVVVDASIRIDGGVGHGREELSRIITTVGAFEGWREELEEMRELGDRIYVVATQRGIGKGSGVEVEFRYAVLYEVREGTITSMTMYNEPAQALEAAERSR